MPKTVLLIMMSLAWLVACAPQASADLDPARSAAIRSEVKAFLERYQTVLSSRDEQAIRKMYISDERFVWFEDGVSRYASVDEILAGLASFPPGMEIKTTYEELTVNPLTADLATVSTQFDTKVTGGNSPDFGWAGVMTMVVERYGGNWRIVTGHSSTPSGRGR